MDKPRAMAKKMKKAIYTPREKEKTEKTPENQDLARRYFCHGVGLTSLGCCQSITSVKTEQSCPLTVMVAPMTALNSSSYDSGTVNAPLYTPSEGVKSIE